MDALNVAALQSGQRYARSNARHAPQAALTADTVQIPRPARDETKAHLVVTNTVLLVGSAQGNGRDNGTR